MAIGELAGQIGDIHHPLAARQVTGFLRRLPRGGSIDRLLDDRARIRGMFLEPLGHLVAHQAFERLADFGRDQLVLGLR